MSGNTSETRCKWCKQLCDPSRPKYHIDSRYDGHDAEPTPLEGEADPLSPLLDMSVVEGLSGELRKAKGEGEAVPEPSGFEGIPKGIANTVSGSEPPVVSTSAPEPPDEVCPNCQGVHAPKVVMSFVKRVAPESYKSAEGPECPKCAKPMRQVGSKAPNTCWTCDCDSAATPVTVEEPEKFHKTAIKILEWLEINKPDARFYQYSSDHVVKTVASIIEVAATPKPIGDVEQKKEQYGIGVTDHLLPAQEAQAESKSDLGLAESIVTKHYGTINELIHGDFVNLVQFILRVSQKG